MDSLIAACHNHLIRAIDPSTPAQLLECRPYWIELAGNVTPVTPVGEQVRLAIRSFYDNRVTFPVRMRDYQSVEADAAADEVQGADEIRGRIAFMQYPRHVVDPAQQQQQPPQRPVCILEIRLPRTGGSPRLTTATGR